MTAATGNFRPHSGGMPLSASASGTPTTGPIPLTVAFTGGGSGGTPPYEFSWDFGDGDDSLLQTPTHVYDVPAPATATLTVTDSLAAYATATVSINPTGSLGGSGEVGSGGLADVFTEASRNTFDPETDLLVMLGTEEPSEGASFGPGSGDATLFAYIPYAKWRSARRYFLGFSYCDTGPPYALHREPPAMYPLAPELRCVGYKVKGYEPLPNPANPNSATYVESPWTDQFGQPMYFPGYRNAKIVVSYRSPGKIRMFGDGPDVESYQDEFRRYTKWNYKPGIEVLQADGQSQLQWAEGPGTTPGSDPDGPVVGTAFPAPIAEMYRKSNLEVTWLSVPWAYLNSDPTVQTLDKILPRVGTVNSDGLFPDENGDPKYPPGTMLLLGVVTEEVMFPVSPVDPTDYPISGLNVTFQWQHIDVDTGVLGSTHRGHNSFIWRIDGFCYYATRANGNTLIYPTDHMAVFSHQADPSTSKNP